MSNNEFDYEMCMRIDNIILPKNGYFGVSAATGGLAGKLTETIIFYRISNWLNASAFSELIHWITRLHLFIRSLKLIYFL